MSDQAFKAETYSSRIKEILKTADLDVVSAKMVRKQIEAEFTVDLKPHKKKFDKVVLDLLEEVEPLEDEKPTSKKKKVVEVKPKPKPKPTIKKVKKPITVDELIQEDNDAAESSIKNEPKTTDEEVALQLHQQELALSSRPARRAASANAPKRRSTNTKRKETSKVKAPTGKKRETAFTRPMILAPPLAQFFNEERMARTQVVKKLWDYIKEHDLQDPKDRRFFRPDEKLSIIFPNRVKVSGFKMNSYISPMFIKPEDIYDELSKDTVHNSSEEESAEEQDGLAVKKPATKKAKMHELEFDEEGNLIEKVGPKRGKIRGGLKTLHHVSPELADIIGVTQAGRGHITKGIWDYIKGKSLQFPTDKRMVACDEKLKTLFGKDVVTMLEVSTLSQRHILEKVAVDNESAAGSTDLVSESAAGSTELLSESVAGSTEVLSESVAGSTEVLSESVAGSTEGSESAE